MEYMGERLVFIFGEQRTGSTLLHHLLGEHPNVTITPNDFDLLRLMHYGKDPEAEEQKKRFSQWDSSYKFNNVLRNPMPQACLRELVYFYFEKSKRTNKGLWIHKTPKGEFNLTTYRLLFPKARFLYIIRNPLAVMASRKYWTESTKGRWISITEKTPLDDIVRSLDFMRNHLNRFFDSLKIIDTNIRLDDSVGVVFYEDLVGKPVVTIKRLCKMLGLQYCKESLIKMSNNVGVSFTSFSEVSSETGIYRASMRKWRTKLTRFEKGVILTEMTRFYGSYHFLDEMVDKGFDRYMREARTVLKRKDVV